MLIAAWRRWDFQFGSVIVRPRPYYIGFRISPSTQFLGNDLAETCETFVMGSGLKPTKFQQTAEEMSI